MRIKCIIFVEAYKKDEVLKMKKFTEEDKKRIAKGVEETGKKYGLLAKEKEKEDKKK